MAAAVEYHGDVSASRAVDPHWWARQPDYRDCGPPLGVAVLLYGSWNVRVASMEAGDGCKLAVPRWASLLNEALRRRSLPPDVNFAAVAVQADADDASLDVCIGEGGLGAPPELPAILLLGFPPASSDGKDDERQRCRVEHVHFHGAALESLLTRPASDDATSTAPRKQLVSSISDALSRMIDGQGNVLPPQPKESKTTDNNSKRRKLNEPAIRIFIAGDRSQVGKTSICLGLLGALLRSGKYAPDDLAYIKPATQCEQTQLVEHYCKARGIAACVPVGPIVYYKGFTRAFLKGETGESSEQLLQKASAAVDELAREKRVVIIDGVGYPAVGSITGTDNASVARACGRTFSIAGNAVRSPAPVLLVGKSGVGDAVDSFNINATYFAHKSVPVVGAVFNKLSLDGFYSLANCKEAVEMYFAKHQAERTPFGFIPELPSLKNAREHAANASEEEQLNHSLEMADAFVKEFSGHVNVDRILQAAKEATEKYISDQTNVSATKPAPKRTVKAMEDMPPTVQNAKHPRLGNDSEQKSGTMMGNFSLTRAQIEAAASAAGAAGG